MASFNAKQQQFAVLNSHFTLDISQFLLPISANSQSIVHNPKFISPRPRLTIYDFQFTAFPLRVYLVNIILALYKFHTHLISRLTTSKSSFAISTFDELRKLHSKISWATQRSQHRSYKSSTLWRKLSTEHTTTNCWHKLLTSRDNASSPLQPFCTSRLQPCARPVQVDNQIEAMHT